MTHSVFVADTNILMDATKQDGAQDVKPLELSAARSIVAALLVDESTLRLGYSPKMTTEWRIKALLEENALLRVLSDRQVLIPLKPKALSKGKAQDLARYVDVDDQIFILTAAAIEGRPKPCVTRDPKTTKPDSRAEVKRLFKVTVLLASEFVEAHVG